MLKEEAFSIAIYIAKVKVLIKEKFKTAAILNSGAKINIIIKAITEKAKLIIY
jgi:hypothetical protein